MTASCTAATPRVRNRSSQLRTRSATSSASVVASGVEATAGSRRRTRSAPTARTRRGALLLQRLEQREPLVGGLAEHHAAAAADHRRDPAGEQRGPDRLDPLDAGEQQRDVDRRRSARRRTSRRSRAAAPRRRRGPRRCARAARRSGPCRRGRSGSPRPGADAGAAVRRPVRRPAGCCRWCASTSSTVISGSPSSAPRVSAWSASTRPASLRQLVARVCRVVAVPAAPGGR